MNRKSLRVIFFSALIVFSSFWLIDLANAASDGKVTICHATNAANNPYLQISINQNGVGNNSLAHHMSHTGPVFAEGMKSGSNWGDIIEPADGHNGLNWEKGEAIFDNGCRLPNDETDEETCEAGPSCPESCGYEGGFTWDTNCEAIECPATESCEITPTPTATPTSTANKEHSSLYVQHLSCDQYDFRAEMDLKSGDQALANVLVTFTYNGLSKNAYTNQDGRAKVSFTFAGEQIVKATPNNGFAAQESKVTQESNCLELGAGNVTDNTGAEYSRVLGANTFAETGVAEDILMSILGLSGATMTAIGTAMHAKKKH
jgi:hypothetical protein